MLCQTGLKPHREYRRYSLSFHVETCKLLKSRAILLNLSKLNITLPIKDHIVEAIFFPIVMFRCESWAIKKAGHQTIDAFELWCWRRLLRIPWTARRSNQSILKEISPEYSLKGLMVKLQYFGHLM